jgi:hypothetical protein
VFYKISLKLCSVTSNAQSMSFLYGNSPISLVAFAASDIGFSCWRSKLEAERTVRIKIENIRSKGLDRDDSDSTSGLRTTERFKSTNVLE